MSIPQPVPLIIKPTPLHRLEQLSADLGIDLWIKRDDLTGFALGGNKGRKLEYLMAEALASGADTVVSCGSAQSNFIRQLGAACSVLGLSCSAAVMHLPYEAAFGQPSNDRLGLDGGNVLLDEILGVDLHVYPDDDWEVLFEHTEELAQSLERQGRQVYRVPIGGSSPLGAYSFCKAAEEIGEGFEQVVTASSSGSTHAGLAYAFHGTSTRVIGISCDPEPDIAEEVARLCGALDDLTGLRKGMAVVDIDLRYGYVGEGYGVPSRGSREAIRLLAQREGIFLDPVYSGKAFAGLLDLAKKGEMPGRTLFWHTGGVPTLFTINPGEAVSGSR